jgi:hypothetical protein
LFGQVKEKSPEGLFVESGYYSGIIAFQPTLSDFKRVDTRPTAAEPDDLPTCEQTTVCTAGVYSHGPAVTMRTLVAICFPGNDLGSSS